MKYLMITILAITLMMSCSKTEEEVDCNPDLSCQQENCLFTVVNEMGTAKFYNCYGRWAIQSMESDSNSLNTMYIVDEWDPSFEEEGLEVIFCGYVRENTAPLVLADPVPANAYQIELVHVEAK